MFIIDSVLKTNPWTYCKRKELNVEKIIGSFYDEGVIINELL